VISLNPEESYVNLKNRIMVSLCLTAAVAAPMAAVVSAQDASVQVRVYDRDHKDYHNWDEHEQAAWARFLAEKHRKDHEWAKADKKEQSEYWNWRHSHPD
jgi:Ni/Co efflux regulator RcnB